MLSIFNVGIYLGVGGGGEGFILILQGLFFSVHAFFFLD